MKFFYIFIFLLLGCENSNRERVNNDENSSEPKQIGYNILKVYAHDTSSFTEGLVWFNNHLYESTGLENKSGIFKIDLLKGSVVKKVKISNPNIFGEGITIFHDTIYQLTWKNRIIYLYDVNNLKKIKEYAWSQKEAWGITHNEKELLISDGSSNIYFVNSDNLKINHVLNVADHNGPVSNINELEFFNGHLYANIWLTNTIIKIDVETGKVVGKIDLKEILEKTGLVYNIHKIDVLNGIAYNPINNHLLVTGKYWPYIFEISLN